MTQIVLTEEQARIVATAEEAVELCDPAGKVVAKAVPTSIGELLAEHRRRLTAGMPRVTGKQVQAHLQALQEEWDRTGGFDKAHMQAFLERLRAQENR